MRRAEAEAILAAHAPALRALGVARNSLFGSTARDEAGPDSDVDLLVDYDPAAKVSGGDKLDLYGYLRDAFGCDVDVVERHNLKPFLRDRIIAEAEGRFVTPTPPKSPRQPLQDILDGIDWIGQITRGKSFADFLGERMLREAVERNIEIISEASRRLPAEMKERHPAIPWKRIADIGNVLRHAYDKTEPVIPWDVVTDKLPALRAVVTTEIAALDGGP